MGLKKKKRNTHPAVGKSAHITSNVVNEKKKDHLSDCESKSRISLSFSLALSFVSTRLNIPLHGGGAGLVGGLVVGGGSETQKA